jgi:hypothetical protein
MKTLGLRDVAFVGAVQAGSSPYSALPTDFAGLVRWYDVANYDDDGLSDTNPVVNNLIDLSITGDDAVPDATYPPHWRDGLMPSGKNCLEWPDGWHHFDLTELTLGDYTCIIVVDAPVSSDQIYFSSTSGNYQVRDESQGSNTTFHPSLYHNAPPVLENNILTANDIWHVAGFRRTVGTGVPRFSTDKTHAAEDSGDTSVASMKINTLGLYNGGLPAAFYAAEMCIYNTVLSDANLDALWDGYWNIKYSGDLGS